MHALVIEDEPKVARSLQRGLEQEGYTVCVAHDGESGHDRLQEEHVDIVVLDLMLPGRDGLELLRQARQEGLRTPVLVLTARDAVEDRVRGLDAGADDYLVKPFALTELLARLRALLRRDEPAEAASLRLGDLELDRIRRSVRRGDRMLELTEREYELLECLLEHRGQPVSRQMLAEEVWRVGSRITPIDNVIDVHVSRLRRKVDRGFPRKLIHTVRGVGYVARVAEPEEAAP